MGSWARAQAWAWQRASLCTFQLHWRCHDECEKAWNMLSYIDKPSTEAGSMQH